MLSKAKHLDNAKILHPDSYRDVQNDKFHLSKQSLLMLYLLISSFAFGQKVGDHINKHFMDSLMDLSRKRVIGKPLAPYLTIGDNVLTDDSLKGKVVFINLWELHCAPCMAEMFALNELYDKLESNKNFKFVSFTFENAEAINEIEQKYHIQYKIYQISQDDCYKVNGYSGFPASIIYNSKGIGQHLYMGGNTDSNYAKKFILQDSIYPAIMRELHPEK